MFSKSFSQPRAGPTGGYSENSHFTVQNIQKSGYFWQFFKFCRISRNIYQMLTPENESSNLHLTHRENRKSDASSILKILPVKGVLFSALAELQPGKVRPCVCQHFSRVAAPRIFPKLCMKSEGDKVRTVTWPVFPGKILDHSKITKRIFADFATLGGFLWKPVSCWLVFVAFYDRTDSLLQLWKAACLGKVWIIQ